ncbi:hypothetical protein BH160DRAFT_2214 [Burkholderia sp. H160]|nr:hypothetical protein BH160DRAFT_2214 [Burkholderia sp. H160]
MRAHLLMPLLRSVNFQMVETGSIIGKVFIALAFKDFRYPV